MVIGFTTTYAISAYHHYFCEFESHSCQGVPDTTLCDKVCQWLVTGRWFSPGTLVSSTNNTDCHNRTEILLKVALSTPYTLTWIDFGCSSPTNFQTSRCQKQCLLYCGRFIFQPISQKAHPPQILGISLQHYHICLEN